MAESERVLLRRFVDAGDAAAFAELVRRYAGLVYGTCLRVLADTDRAADATQETFFQLMKKAGEIRGSLGGWLHRVAVRKAVDLVRLDRARRSREEKYLQASSDDEKSWQEVSPYVDEALDHLDDETRAVLVRHYLEGRSMTDLAQELGVSRATVSRRIETGLTRVQSHLRKKGVLVATAGLTALLTEGTARSAPAALLQQLGKMSLLGVHAGSAATAAASSSVAVGGLVAAVKTKLIVAAAGVVMVGAGLVTYQSLSSQPPRTGPIPPAVDREDRDSERLEAPPQMEQPQATETEVQPPQPPATDNTTPAAAIATAPDEAPAPVVDEQAVTSGETAQEDGFHLDLSSPEATVRSFTKAIVSGNAESVMACFLPGGTDHEDMQEILHANPDDPKQRGQYEMKLWLQAIDPDAEMPVVETTEAEGAVGVTWQVTFKKDVTVSEGGGHTFRAGDTYNLDATLRKAGDSWLIDNF